MFKLYKLGSEENTTINFESEEKVVKFLCGVYDYVWRTKYNDGSLFECKTTAISQYKICEWVMMEGEKY